MGALFCTSRVTMGGCAREAALLSHHSLQLNHACLAAAGTLAAVRLRFVALRTAVRKFPTGASAAALPVLAPKEAGLPAPGSRRARLPRGALAEAAMGASGNASEESEP